MSGFVQDWAKNILFPLGTLAVNLTGCFAIGLLFELVEARGLFTAEARAFVFIGVLGGFTTFSTFGNETINLWRDGENSYALINIAAHVLVGLAAVWGGRALAHTIWG